jgi:hypothetical protein
LVATDSDGVRREGTKFFVLPPIDAVLVGRGSMLFVETAANAIYSLAPTLDETLDKLPSVLPVLFDAAIKVARELGAGIVVGGGAELVPPEANEIYLVGFSPRQDRMTCTVFSNPERDRNFVARHRLTRVVEPWHSVDEKDQPDISTLAAMISAARTQVRLVRQVAPAIAAGGRLIVAEVRRGQMRIATVAE